MSDYKKFVKSYFEKYRGEMDAKTIIKLAAKDWKKVGKSSKSKGGNLSESDDETEHGAGMSAGSLKMKKAKGKRVSGRKNDVHGAGWFDDAISGIGQGVGLVMNTAKQALPLLPLLA